MSAYVLHDSEQWYHCACTNSGLGEDGFNYLRSSSKFFLSWTSASKDGSGQKLVISLTKCLSPFGRPCSVRVSAVPAAGRALGMDVEPPVSPGAETPRDVGGMRGCCTSPHPLSPCVTQETFQLKFLRVVDGKGETESSEGKGQRGARVLPSALGDMPLPGFHQALYGNAGW